MQRYLLTATLAANYGIYGPAFELYEGRALKPGSEEYLDSEKFQIRKWDLDREDSLRELITQVNAIRRSHPAFQYDTTLRFLHIDNDDLLAFTKTTPDGGNMVLVVVNLDPKGTGSGRLTLEGHRPMQLHELLTNTRTHLRTDNTLKVNFEAGTLPARIYAVRHHLRTERDFEYFL